ncbi:MAG: GlyGly-CTERM sorting domain-containing protein [Pseudomonadales bacterium]|nr:GlyGly-CTERM sorting domain-containing protein [Pseudomonadales bacterium]
MSKLFKKVGKWILAASSLVAANSYATVVGQLQNGTDFYMLDDATNSIYHYDLSTAGDDIDSLFSLPGTPSTFTYDGANFFVTFNNAVWSVSPAGVATRLRNITGDSKGLIVQGDYLIVLFGSSNQALMSIDKSNGDLIDIAPDFADPEDFVEIKRIFFLAPDQVVMQLSAANDDSSEFVGIEFDSATGTFDNLTYGTIDGNDFSGIGETFYLDDKQMLVDPQGQVVNFSTSPITYPHSTDDDIGSPAIVSNLSDTIATDSTIIAAGDSTNFAYVSTTLDNECNPVAQGGSRITRYTGTTDLSLATDHYYDTENSIHSIATTSSGADDDLFLFSGSGNDLQVEIVTASDFENPIRPWLDPWDPSDGDFDVSADEVFVDADETTLLMHVDDGCYHLVQFWDTVSNTYTGYTETYWTPEVMTYVPNQERFYIGYTLEDQAYLRIVDTTAPGLATIEGYLDASGINFMMPAGDFVVMHVETEDGQAIRSYSAAALLDEEVNGTSTIDNCCDTWTQAVYDATRSRIYYTTAEGLFAINIDAATGLFSGPSIQSTTEPLADLSSEGSMSLSDDDSILFVSGFLFDADDLSYLDNIGTDATYGFFDGSNLYTLEAGATYISTWPLSAGTDNHVGTESRTIIEGTGISILPILDGASTTPVALSSSSSGQLLVSKPLTSEEPSGLGEDTSTDSDTESDDDSSEGGSGCTGICNQVPDGTRPSSGGGSMNWFILTGLLGLALRTKLSQP